MKICPDITCQASEGEQHRPNCWYVRKLRTEILAEAAAYPTTGTGPLRIVIEPVMHQEQRYDTCGDYYLDKDPIDIAAYEGPVLRIRVSELVDRREMHLIAIHELIEWALCQTAGITNEEIDKFDINFESQPLFNNSNHEPGDDPRAPYYRQHQIATAIERLLAAEMGVDWLTYDQHIKELSNSPKGG